MKIIKTMFLALLFMFVLNCCNENPVQVYEESGPDTMTVKYIISANGSQVAFNMWKTGYLYLRFITPSGYETIDQNIQKYSRTAEYKFLKGDYITVDCRTGEVGCGVKVIVNGKFWKGEMIGFNESFFLSGRL